MSLLKKTYRYDHTITKRAQHFFVLLPFFHFSLNNNAFCLVIVVVTQIAQSSESIDASPRLSLRNPSREARGTVVVKCAGLCVFLSIPNPLCYFSTASFESFAVSHRVFQLERLPPRNRESDEAAPVVGSEDVLFALSPLEKWSPGHHMGRCPLLQETQEGADCPRRHLLFSGYWPSLFNPPLRFFCMASKRCPFFLL